MNMRQLSVTFTLTFIFAVSMFATVPPVHAASSCLAEGKCTTASDCAPTQSCVDAYYLPELHTWNARGGVACGGTCVTDPAKAAVAKCTTVGANCTATDGYSGSCTLVGTSLTCISFVSQIPGTPAATLPAGMVCPPSSNWVTPPGQCQYGDGSTAAPISGTATAPKSATAPATGSLGQPANSPASGSLGQPSNTGTNVTLINPLKGGASLESFLNNILDFVIRIGAIIVVLMLVYVGFLFVTAQGNETKITEARKALLWTVVGALILLGAKAIALGITATVQALSVGQ